MSDRSGPAYTRDLPSLGPGATDTAPIPTVKYSAKYLFVFAFAAFAAAPAVQAQREKLPPEHLEYVEKTWPEAKKTNTGIRYIVLREGQGDAARPGDRIHVLYVGRLLDGKVFDKAEDPEKAFTFRVRRGEVIEGWDQIAQDMKAGEKRLVIIPPELAYGTRGQPSQGGRSVGIPRNSTLVFEMEIVKIERK